MPEDGIYYPDGTFKTASQLRLEALQAGKPIYHTPFPEQRDFQYWQEEMIRRRDARIEYEGHQGEIEIEIPTDKPICIAQVGDQHIADLYHAYEMMGYDATVIREHPLMYAAIGGDLFSGFMWNPPQDKKLASFWEEREHARQYVNHIGADKVLWAIPGDHDGPEWEGKYGGNFYTEFQYRYQAYLIRGVTKIRLRIGEQDYTMVTAHRLPGFSMYSEVHPLDRARRFGIVFADTYGCFHTHQKGIKQSVQHSFDGAKRQLLWVPGPYKYNDDYAEKHGLGRLDHKQLGPVWLVFYPDRHLVQGYWSADEAISTLAPYL